MHPHSRQFRELVHSKKWMRFKAEPGYYKPLTSFERLIIFDNSLMETLAPHALEKLHYILY